MYSAMIETDDSRDRFPTAEMLTTGLIAGLGYFLVNLIFFFPEEQLGLLQGGFLRVNLFAYSFAVWVVAFTLVSAVLYAVTQPLGLQVGSVSTSVRRLIVFGVLAFGLSAGLSVWTYYVRSAPLIPRYIVMRDVKAVLLRTALITALASLGLSLVVGRLPGRLRPGRRRVKPLALVVTICLAYVVIANLVGGWIVLRGPSDGDRIPEKQRIVILGVDAGSWNVLLPTLNGGALPAFRRMMEEGVYGYFDTYGPQFTPPAWTSIATGKRSAKHGVFNFGFLSSDWKAAPIWSIMSSAGRRVAVVNWICTWPPFEVNGTCISKVMSDQPGRVYLCDDLRAYAADAESILTQWEYLVPGADDERMSYAGREIAILTGIEERIVSHTAPDFVAYYYYSTDMLQHFFWHDMTPEVFTGRDWDDEVPDPTYEDAISESWVWADAFLADLMATYGPRATYLIVSDHGARPVMRRMASLDIAGLLGEMGYLSMRGGVIHKEGSICFPSEAWSPYYRFDITINRGEYADLGEINLERYRELAGRIADDLRRVTLDGSGESIFESVQPRQEPGSEGEADVTALASKTIMEMPEKGAMIAVGDRRLSLEMLLRVHPWSGRHRARGILMARGPAIKRGYTGAWTIDDAYTSIFRYTHGVLGITDRIAPLLRRLHLIDEATTLDLAPTLLYLTGLPVAEDMDGRILAELIAGAYTGEHRVDYITSYGMGDVSDLVRDAADEEKIKERLRALGYIQ
jgi:predicted AlkP superfamily phosphohydrolase/phosphomutase